ncbi:MAG: carbohydrate diacid regulator, partial [Halanaerobium sp.]
MNLNRELAEKIVIKTMHVLGKNINIMNSQGIIIGSGDSKRLNTFHEIAGEVIKTQEAIIIKEEETEEYKGVKAGINLPIIFNEDIIGVVGITGKVDEVSGYGKLVKNMVELILQQEFLRHEIEIDNRAKENFYQQILNENIQNQDLLNDRLKLFNIKKDLNRIVFVISFDTFDAKLVTNTVNDLNNLVFIKK